MEDSFIAESLGNGKYIFGVFDGHGGSEVAEFVKRHFVNELEKNENYKKSYYEKALGETFMQMDIIMLKDEG